MQPVTMTHASAERAAPVSMADIATVGAELGVKTKAQLVMMIRVLGQPSAETFASLDNA